MSTLLALVTAITVLTIVLTGTLIVVEDAFRDGQRGDAERSVAIQVSDRLVAADGPLADRPNVVDEAAVDTLDDGDLRSMGASDRFAVAVDVDGEEAASVGDPGSGHVVRRLVQVEERDTVERTPPLETDGDPQTTLPVRTDQIELAIDPPAGTTVTTVRSGDRVVLADDGGLAGTHVVDTSRYRTLELTFESEGPLTTGDVEVAYATTSRERAILAVTVQDTEHGADGGERT